ncbi:MULTISPECIES: hypothetical protein [unclassified Mesorhizobium]|uniref:hypothetical protein n=1 Tax=unclassified Mesorhizobium TaxID=325217 RepID=UPI000AFADB08|nr:MULTISPECIES: hypothetical protein [unclassified Mesorhizobium]MBN9255288.1 hypothetical protein [Mesorhizobium sp.]
MSRDWTDKDLEEAEASVSNNPLLSHEQRQAQYAALDEISARIASEERDNADFVVTSEMIEAGVEALREAAPAGHLPFDRQDVVLKIYKAMLRRRT